MSEGDTMPVIGRWRDEERSKWIEMTDDERFDMHMTVRANRADAKLAADRLESEVERLQAEKQAVLDCVNLYGDEVLHDALDAIGWPNA